MKDIVIIGAGDFGKETAWLIEDINKNNPTYKLLGFLDDFAEKGKVINGYSCLGNVAYLTELNKNKSVHAIIAMQNVKHRKRFVDMFPDFDNWETLIHPSVRIAPTSVVGKGCVICAGGTVSCNSVIGDFCLLNISVTIGHDCNVGNYVSIMSGSCVSGHVVIEDYAYLATNCTVVPKMKIGESSVVGAGSVVLRKVKPNTTVFGVPAKVMQF